jgi:tetratricopeptide (TPR) repeat protein
VSAGLPGAYPGNLSLPKEVRDKIVSTFRHTLDLYKDGKLDDCLIGCDFILKMDPRFAPARKLQEKARNPKADVNLEELRAVLVAEAVAPPPLPEPPGSRTTQDVPFVSAPRPAEPSAFGGLEDLSLDSLSLDGPVSDFTAPAPAGEFGLPFDPGALPPSVEAPIPGLSQGPLAGDPELSYRAPASVEEEIAALLKQGDEARFRGDRQQAIEIWSRVFLIDINDEEAVSRIEATRQEMTDESHRLASAIAQGQESFARGDLNAARTQFDAILTLDDPTPAAPTPGAYAPAAPAPPPREPTAPLPPHDLSAVSASSDVLAEEMDQSGPPGRRSWTSVLRPPEETTGVAEAAASVEKRTGIALGGRLPLLAGALVLILGAGAYFFLRGPAEEPPAVPAEAGASLEHATALFREGKIAETVEELGRIPRGHPDYAKAQKLLASLSGPAAANPPSDPAGSSAPPPAAPAGGTGTEPSAVRARAERALAEKRYIDALKGFSLAAPHFREDPSFSQQMAAASTKVSELTPAVKLYNDSEYETAIPMLWRIYQAGRDNQDARSYLLRSYFNQGIAQLQNGLYEKAKESFGEVLALDAQDEEAARHRRFAERYRTGDLDLLGQIYVRYVSPRP